MKRLLLILSLACPIFGQATHILPGDKCYQSGQVWPGPVVEWGSYFTCSLPLKAGSYTITFTTQEIPASNITAAGQRVFTINMLGQTTAPIDIFKSVGTGIWNLTTTFNMLFDQTLTIYFRAQIRNAIMTTIDIAPALGTITISDPSQILGVPCAPGWQGKVLSDGTCLAVNATY